MLTADDLRPCAGCGTPCDGDVCDSGCWEIAEARADVLAGLRCGACFGWTCDDCGGVCHACEQTACVETQED